MRRLLAVVRRLVRSLVPARYAGRRDRLSPEADQGAAANSFRGGM